jgi:hypothetical protein
VKEIQSDPGEANLKDIYINVVYSLTYNPHSMTADPIPLPYDYPTYDLYICALHDWYIRLLARIYSLYLPSTLACSIHAPQKPKLFTKEEKQRMNRFRTFLPRTWPLFSINYLDMLNIVIKGIRSIRRSSSRNRA